MATSADNFGDLQELGIDLDASDSLTDTFHKAANHLQGILPTANRQTLLTLYGYYKQAIEGPCNTPKPSWYDTTAKSKWAAWNDLKDMSKSEAQLIYIHTIKKLDPTFNTAKESWVSVSTLQNHTLSNEDTQKTIFDFVKDGDSTQVSSLLKAEPDALNKLDGEGLGLIHWAADRGSVDILEMLVNFGADVNLQDSDGQTALHYASSCGHSDCIELLLSNNANKDIRDNDDSTPIDVASDDVKELLVALG